MTNIQKQKLWRHELKRMQHYLGLVSGLQTFEGEHGSTIPSDLPVVLVSIDLEAFEFNRNIITEVGISTLYGSDICNVPPGPSGRDWISKIHAMHFRVAETKHLVNKRHVEGCPENFEFGRSEMISQQNLVQFLQDFFRALRCPPCLEAQSFRKVILVGHSVESDLKYLKTLGFDPTSIISDCIDTINLNRVARRNARELGLGKLLVQENLPNKYLHNAGNDACYTLQAAITISVDSVFNGKSSEYWEREKAARIKKAVEDVIAKTSAEFNGWSSSDDDDEQIRNQLSMPPREVYRISN